jgi:hypothetical protein
MTDTVNPWKWDAETKDLLKSIEEVADSTLKEPGLSYDTINTYNASHSIIESGRNEIRGSVGALFVCLDQLDERDRLTAYSALYHVLHGVRDVAWQALVPVGGNQQDYEDRSRAFYMRERKQAENAPRDGIVAAVIRENPKLAIKQQLHLINSNLRKNGLRELGVQAYRRLRKKKNNN